MQCRNYVGVACVNGSCPMALKEKYAEQCIPTIKDCRDCWLYRGCEDCALCDTEYCSENNDSQEERKMLILPIKKKWYDMILSGEKTEEYREIKPYYETRFESVFGCMWLFRGIKGIGDTTPPEKEIIFRNGYSRNSRQIVVTCTLTIGTGKPEWGAEPGVKYYVLHIKRIQEVTE